MIFSASLGGFAEEGWSHGQAELGRWGTGGDGWVHGGSMVVRLLHPVTKKLRKNHGISQWNAGPLATGHAWWSWQRWGFIMVVMVKITRVNHMVNDMVNDMSNDGELTIILDQKKIPGLIINGDIPILYWSTFLSGAYLGRWHIAGRGRGWWCRIHVTLGVAQFLGCLGPWLGAG